MFFGLFKKKPKPEPQPKPLDLQVELFSLLRAGKIEAAADEKYSAVNFDWYFTAVSAGRYYISKEKDKTVNLAEDEFFNITGWTLKSKKDFFAYQAGFNSTSEIDILTPLSYFAYQGNLKAVEYMLSRKLGNFETVDHPEARCFRAPIYFALNDLAMAELFVNHGARITDNVVAAAAKALKGYADEDLSVLSFLIKKGGNISVAAQALIEKDKSVNVDVVLSRLQAVAGFSRATGASAQQGPAISKPDTFVKYETKIDDLTMVEIYDFSDNERVTIMRRGNGDVQGAPLCETFNALGRDHRGLNRAIDDFTAKGGVYEPSGITKGKIVEQVRAVL